MYQQAPQWRRFNNIVEMEGDDSEISHTTSDSFFINQLNGNLFIQVPYEMLMPVSIYDMNGKLIYSTVIVKSVEVPINNFIPGVYIVKIGKTSHKILVN